VFGEFEEILISSRKRYGKVVGNCCGAVTILETSPSIQAECISSFPLRMLQLHLLAHKAFAWAPTNSEGINRFLRRVPRKSSITASRQAKTNVSITSKRPSYLGGFARGVLPFCKSSLKMLDQISSSMNT
jgi:hypothetical protein